MDKSAVLEQMFRIKYIPILYILAHNFNELYIQDIEKVFPRLFNMNWDNGVKKGKNSQTLNQIFINDGEKIQKLTALLKEKLHDKQFQAFQQSY